MLSAVFARFSRSALICPITPSANLRALIDVMPLAGMDTGADIVQLFDFGDGTHDRDLAGLMVAQRFALVLCNGKTQNSFLSV